MRKDAISKAEMLGLFAKNANFALRLTRKPDERTMKRGPENIVKLNLKNNKIKPWHKNHNRIRFSSKSNQK